MSATRKPKALFIGYGHLAKSLITKKLLSFVNIHALNSKKVIRDINLKKKIKIPNKIKIEIKKLLVK